MNIYTLANVHKPIWNGYRPWISTTILANGGYVAIRLMYDVHQEKWVVTTHTSGYAKPDESFNPDNGQGFETMAIAMRAYSRRKRILQKRLERKVYNWQK